MTLPLQEILSKYFNTMQRKAFGLCVAVFLIAVSVSSCTKVDSSYAEFRSMPQQGWATDSPLHFALDSLNDQDTYDVKIAVRYTPEYPYRNLSVAVDMIAVDGNTKRLLFDFPIADQYGNRLGAGFGSLYQCEQTVAKSVPHSQIHRIVVWNRTQADSSLRGVSDVGVIVTRSAQ